MDKSTVVPLSGREVNADALTELLRSGAQTLIYQAVEAELAEFLSEVDPIDWTVISHS